MTSFLLSLPLMTDDTKGRCTGPGYPVVGSRRFEIAAAVAVEKPDTRRVPCLMVGWTNLASTAKQFRTPPPAEDCVAAVPLRDQGVDCWLDNIASMTEWLALVGERRYQRH